MAERHMAIYSSMFYTNQDMDLTNVLQGLMSPFTNIVSMVSDKYYRNAEK